MKKLLFSIQFLIICFSNNEINAQTPQWSNWGTLSCYKGLQSRNKCIGFNKVVNKYEWICQVQNNYDTKVGLEMSWTDGGEEINIGRFDVSPGNTTHAATYYFNSNASRLLVTVSKLCFEGRDCSAHCYADCDSRPGVVNQPPCNT